MQFRVKAFTVLNRIKDGNPSIVIINMIFFINQCYRNIPEARIIQKIIKDGF